MFDGRNGSGMGYTAMGPYMQVDPSWTDNWMKISTENLHGKEQEEEEEDEGEVRISIELIEGLEKVEAPGAHGDYAPQVIILNLPFFGRLHILKNKVGVINVFIIVLYWIYGTWCNIFVILKPHYEEGHISQLPMLYYAGISALCIASLFRACTANPGRIPFSREIPVSPEHLTRHHCQECRRRKPQKSHHCRRCGQCILRMDHHCPWINNCVGQENHWMFIQLLWYAFLMSASSFIFCMLHYYYWPPCAACDKQSFIVSHATGLSVALVIMASFMFLFMLLMIINQLYSILSVYFVCNHMRFFLSFATFLSFLMMFGSGSLLMIQYISLKRDMTTIDWMKLNNAWKSGKWDPSKMPVISKSCVKAHEDLCGPGPRWMWPFPCRKRRGPLHIHYPEIV